MIYIQCKKNEVMKDLDGDYSQICIECYEENWGEDN